MDELFEDGPGNTPEYSVSEITGAVKRVIEGEFSFVRVRGEVGRVVVARTGHMYFDLKDDRSVIACVSWKGQVSKFRHKPEEGMEVVATGRMTTFGPQSKYQLNVESVEPAGAGALMAMLEARKKKLEAEGLFAVERKRPLPFLPEIIGVVTSPQGAVIRDILHRLRDRFPRKVLVWPVAVQGQNCAPEVARAIEGFNRMTPGGAMPRPDLIIVARGGGSIEDLWGFNEEIVARAAAASDIPLISAVGHETDTTLIDYVSDYRAPTPTGAAERAVPVRVELMAWLDGMSARLVHAETQGIVLRGQRLRDLSRALPRVEALLDAPRQRLDYWAERLPSALTHGVQRRRVALSEASGSLRPGVLRGRVDAAKERLADRAQRLEPALTRGTQRRREALEARAARLRVEPIRQDITRKRRDLAALVARLKSAGETRVARLGDRLEAVDRLRKTMGYEATLERGYAVVRDGGSGAVLTRKAEAEAAGALEVQFADGRIRIGGAAPAKGRRKDEGPDQGSLF
ncbi:exodeoxyribonuclease VII large subunit [Oceanicola sp. 22II-s10i]|uniref:exodeoxyribonuclease VII large subunit n=1 Tax=Oceanicola sp. 22II-s10i TaxID=1317116 RepID=UPI000B5228BB|nr:exodeoxyribonuclease VII large subunit [Oceanicola sp. 22II-s10i]OWU85218.1 exodeoxyribonuclease VII large subunit [Oceanicola sp. 22II-s10i]